MYDHYSTNPPRVEGRNGGERSFGELQKDTHAILYYAPDEKQVLSENTGWDSFKFIRTNETLCMEVRPESDSE
jgi:hypothetical protein